MSKDQQYTISLKSDAITIDNMEIDASTAAKIVRLIMPLGGDVLPGSEGGASALVTEDDTSSGAMTAKQFMTQKGPQSDIERVTCLAYYLTHNKGIGAFKTIDLTHLNVEAAQPRLSNPSLTARNAVTQQYLAPAGGGKKLITSRGEAVVRAMPDRTKVKDALEKNPLHGKKRKATSKRAKNAT